MGRTTKFQIALFTSEPSTVTGRKKKKVIGRVKLKLLINLTGSQLSLHPGGKKNHLQHPRCKSQLNCQIPGTEPRAGEENPRWHLLSKSPCPGHRARVTAGGGRRRPSRLPGAPPVLPAACLKSGGVGVPNLKQHGTVLFRALHKLS